MVSRWKWALVATPVVVLGCILLVETVLYRSSGKSELTTNPVWELSAAELGVNELRPGEDITWFPATSSWSCEMAHFLSNPSGLSAPVELNSHQFGQAGNTLLHVSVSAEPGPSQSTEELIDFAAYQLSECAELAPMRYPLTRATGTHETFSVAPDGLTWAEVRKAPFTPETAGQEAIDPYTPGSGALPFLGIEERQVTGSFASIENAFVAVNIASAGPPEFTPEDVMEVVRPKIEANPPPESPEGPSGGWQRDKQYKRDKFVNWLRDLFESKSERP